MEPELGSLVVLGNQVAYQAVVGVHLGVDSHHLGVDSHHLGVGSHQLGVDSHQLFDHLEDWKL